MYERLEEQAATGDATCGDLGAVPTRALAQACGPDTAHALSLSKQFA